MKLPNFLINYDKEADVLYVSFGPSQKGIAVDLGEGDLVRIDPYTCNIVGVTIIDFRYKYGEKPGLTLEEKTARILPEILESFEEYKKTHRMLS